MSPTRLTTPELILAFSRQYGVNSVTIDKVVSCETAGTYDPLIQSYVVKNGVREDSWGLAQIHLPSHPDITKEQAKDPEFAIEFMAKNFADGKQNMWSCYKILAKRGEV